MRYKFSAKYKQIDNLLRENGENLTNFLLSLAAYNKKAKYYWKHKRKFKYANRRKRIYLKRIRKLYLRKNIYLQKLKTDTIMKFKIMCEMDGVDSRTLLEAFMNAYVEGGPEIEELMKNINLYHNNLVLKDYSIKSLKSRLISAKKIIDRFNIPLDWWKKYSDLNIEELDF